MKKEMMTSEKDRKLYHAFIFLTADIIYFIKRDKRTHAMIKETIKHAEEMSICKFYIKDAAKQEKLF